MSIADDLLVELRQSTRKRVPLQAIWVAFHRVAPANLTVPQARSKLAAALAKLCQQHEILLPKGNASWDQSVRPPVPRWVDVVRPSLPTSIKVHQTTSWPPELVFVATLKHCPQTKELLAIKSFLANGGRQRPCVPVRERSAELFEDEKRLDKLRKSVLFGPGRLTLQLLRCHDVVPPLVWEACPGRVGRPILILENLHTYASFCRWNKEAAVYAAIVYGHGNAFLKTYRDVPRIVATTQASSIEYFGDLDPKGVAIPCQASSLLQDEGHGPLNPATRWYEQLLSSETGFPLAKPPSQSEVAALDWLPQTLATRTRDLFELHRRLPQELVGWEKLKGS